MHFSERPALDRLTRTRSALLTSAPFFGSLALQHCRLVERADVETATVNGESLFFNPAYVETLSEAETVGLWVCLVMHLASLHHARRGSRDLALWNEACDYAIHPRVIAAGYTLPPGAPISAEFEGMAAEQIFAILDKRRRDQQGQPQQQPGQGQGAGQGQPQPGQGQGQPGQGQPGAAGQPGQPGQGQPGPGAAPDPGRCGGIVDAAPDAAGNDAAAAEMESTIRQSIAVAAAANGGTIPDAAAVILGELNRPRVDWRATVERFIDDAAQRIVDWNRPNRRFLGSGFFLPATAPDSVSCIGVGLDVSGSIDQAALSALGSELQGILDSGRVERLHVVAVNTHVTGFWDFVPGDSLDLELKGRGGTAFAPAWAHFEAHGINPAAVVYLTDLDPARGTWGAEPPYPVLWAVYGRKRDAPFGEVIPLDPHS